MGKRVALVGDMTTTGGKIITGENNVRSEGMPAALVGDKVFCPKCDKTGTIIEGCQVFIVEGKPAAYDGCLIACDCPIGTNRIIAANSFIFVDDSSAPYSIPIPRYTTLAHGQNNLSNSNNYTNAANQNLATMSSQLQNDKTEKTEDVEAYLITTYGYIIESLSINEIGDHSALYIHIKGEFPFLYDPNGSYLSGTRGSGGFFADDEANLNSYVSYQSRISTQVIKTKLTLTKQQASNIINNAMDMGDSGFALYCANNVSNVLKDDYGNEGGSWLPSSLRDEIEQIEASKR